MRDRSPPRGGPFSGSGFIRPPNPNPSNVLGVFGLSHMTRQRDLEDIFGKFGPSKKIILVIDRRVKFINANYQCANYRFLE